MPPLPTLKRRYTCEEAVLITMDQLPMPPRRASINTALVRDNVSFDERSHKLAAVAVERFGHLGVEGSKFTDQLAVSLGGGGMVGRWEGKDWLRNAYDKSSR